MIGCVAYLRAMKHTGWRLGAACAFLFSAAAAQAVPVNLVQNGDFELSAGVGQIGYNTTVSGWNSSGGYNFLFTPGTADTTGATTWFNSPLMLWGANNGGAAPLAVSANGGNFIANDGAYGVAALEQTINGLVAGHTYQHDYEWAAAQQYGFTGDTTEWWRVNLGNNSATAQATGIYANASHSSSPWMQASMLFTASSTSELLSFIANGTPGGEPPFSLLDGVSLMDVSPPPSTANVPEPASLALLLGGLGALGYLSRRRRGGV